MPRPKTFDTSLALNKAMMLFWRQGYTRTSMRHLENATGLSAGSIYHEFGSKQALFDRALHAYIDHVIKARITRHLDGAEDPLSGVEQFMLSSFIALPSTYQQLSCLLVNTAAELDQNESRVGTTLKYGLKLIDDALARTLERAKDRSQLPKTLNTADSAKQLGLMLPGILLAAKNDAPHDVLERAIKQTLSQLKTPTAADQHTIGERHD